MSDKSPFAKNLEALPPEQFERVKGDFEAELARRNPGPNVANMSAGEFERYKDEMLYPKAKGGTNV